MNLSLHEYYHRIISIFVSVVKIVDAPFLLVNSIEAFKSVHHVLYVLCYNVSMVEYMDWKKSFPRNNISGIS